nr:hypothetical protein BaRGS_026643 [Batillaria attramentaria]
MAYAPRGAKGLRRSLAGNKLEEFKCCANDAIHFKLGDLFLLQDTGNDNCNGPSSTGTGTGGNGEASSSRMRANAVFIMLMAESGSKATLLSSRTMLVHALPESPKDFLQQQGIRALQWPSPSPDLNPIEHF